MRKILAVILSLSLIFIYFAVAVSATEITNSMTSKEYYASQAYLVAKFKDGDITYSEFQTRSQAVTDAYVEANTVGGVLTQSALTASNTFNAVAQKIGETVSNFGDSAKDYISDWISDFLDDYTVFSDKSSTDTKGYGAMMYVVTQGKNYASYSRYYCNYILAKPSDSYITYYTQGGYYREYWSSSNSTVQTYTSSSNFGEHNRVEGSSTTTVFVYGDVRYEDGSQAPTDDEFQTVKDYDFTQTPDGEPVSEQDLLELLNDILEELERQQPDLSNVEGLLKSIYNRLGRLDSDNDNALLSEINAAILALAKDTNSNNTALINALDELKQSLKDGGDSETLKELADNVKDISNTLKGLVAIEVAENILELTEGEQQLFNEYANLIPLIINKFGFAVVSQHMQDIEQIIFISSEPSDIVVNMYGEDVTILSTSIFSADSKKYIDLAKIFISVIILYSWCMIMRKKLVGEGS